MEENMKKGVPEKGKRKEYASPMNERIAMYRKRAGLTQVDAAAALGMSSKSYSYMERNGKVTGEQVKILARLFRVPAVWILDGEDNAQAITQIYGRKPVQVKQSTYQEAPSEPEMKSTSDYIANLYDHLPKDLQFEVFDFITNAYRKAKERDNT